MFYSHNILQKKGGRFGIIWIAATKASTLTKREYVTVKIVDTCQDIVNYIMLRAEPLSTGNPQPRLSLYLSSQLMCGVVRVYKKQCEYFVDEVINFHSRLSSGRFIIDLGAEIDLPVPKKPSAKGKHTLPEISMSDPEFGMVRLAPLGAQPYIIPEEDVMMVSPPPPILTDSSGAYSPYPSKKLKMDVPHLAPSPESIQLRESPSPVIQTIQIPGGEVDLPSFDTGFAEAMARVQAAIDSLQAPPMSVDDQPSFQETEKEDEGLWLIEEDTGQLVLSPVHRRKTRRQPKDKPEAKDFRSMEVLPPPEITLSPHLPTIEQLTASSADEIPLADISHRPAQQEVATQVDITTAVAPQEVSPQADDISARAPPQEVTTQADISVQTPPQEVTPQADRMIIPSLELSPIEESAPTPRRGKKRRLVFADEDIQLRKEVMRQNLSTSNELCKTSDIMSIKSYPSPSELFKLPTRVGIRKSNPLMDVWRRHAVPCDYESPTEAGHPIWSIYYLRDAPSSADSPMSPEVNREVVSEFSEMEGLRDTTHDSKGANFDMTPASLLTETSRLSEHTRDSIQLEAKSERTGRRLTTESIDEVPNERGMLEQLVPVKEEGREVSDEYTMRDEFGEITSDEHTVYEEGTGVKQPLSISQETVLREISNLTSDGPMTFHELCPPGTYRQLVAKVFTVCLELNVLGIIRMSQRKFYGRILIERGLKF